MRFGETHDLPVLAPVDAGSTTKYTDVVFLKNYESVKFCIPFGVITGDDIQVTVEECDNATPSNHTAIPFKYRKSAAVDSDSMGDVSDALAAGVTIAAGDDGKALYIEVDGRQLSDGYPAVRCVIDPGSSASVCLVAATAELFGPRYAGEGSPSAIA